MFPIFLLCLVSTFQSIILHPISSLRARIPTISSILSLECIDLFFCSTTNVTSLFFHHFSFLSNRRIILASTHHFAVASILHSAQCAASAFIFSLGCCRLCFCLQFSQTQWHISIDVVVFESSSSSSFQVFIFLVLFLVSCMLESLHRLFLSLSLPPPSLLLLSLRWLPCVAICI